MIFLTTSMRRFFQDDEGATAVEYGVMIALIIAAVIAIVILLGDQIQEAFESFSDELAELGITGGG
ncbi:MAG: Flp family type IVb pilin [Desulfuromonas sp.]|nr:MAG: Flp family type IVb pilin [Desulfuromonas sp.]